MQGGSHHAAPAGSVRDRLAADLGRERSAGVPIHESQERIPRKKERLRRLRSGEDGGLDPKEALRRSRISAANRGKVPWNKGGSHTPGAPRMHRPCPCKEQITSCYQDPSSASELPHHTSTVHACSCRHALGLLNACCCAMHCLKTLPYMGAETIALIRERVVEVLAQPDMKLKLRRNNLRQLHSPETRVRPFMSHQTHLPCLFQTAVALWDTQVALGSAAEVFLCGL